MKPLHALSLAIAMAAVAGCASITRPEAVDVPRALAPPASESAYVQATATGVQIYKCTFEAGEPVAWSWKFREPEASLFDSSGRLLGKHYAGPTWESVDGSTVVGKVAASAPAPDASAIAWLLLSARSSTGDGLFARVTSIQRVGTAGGVAPSAPCSAANDKQVVRVPYRATYTFYRARQASAG